ALALRYPIAAGQQVALGDVRVRGQRPPADGATRPYSNRNAVVLQVGDLAKNAESRTLIQYLQGRVAGVAVSGNSINIRQSSTLQDQSTGGFGLVQPLFLIDGAIVPADVFTSFPLREVETIDVLNQNAAAMFGSQGYGGVIAAYTRQAGPSYAVDPQAQFAAARAGVLSAQIPGYYRAREFYAPRYEAPATRPDPRYTTLYWAPTVRTDASGQAQLSFFTADAGGTFQIVAERLSAQGTPLRGCAVLVVQGDPGK
ncbi:TonB-dependent receptor, partial [Hymenobacter coccineus]|uniref:TonB-dependent receptor n=1 Tax=Hymenobacter coccineus TaxID=1908235 RepID=UPI000AA98425